MNTVDAMCYPFLAPVIVHGTIDKDALPDKLHERIKIERLINIAKNEELATDSEAIAYLMTASMAKPLDSKWTDIYVFLTKKYMQSINIDFSEIDFIKAAPNELSDYKKGELDRLKSWIFKKTMEAYNEKKKAHGGNSLKDAPAIEPKKGVTLFDFTNKTVS